MFCNQCEQTARGTGCTVRGVCGKVEHVSQDQDYLIEALRRLAQTALKAGRHGLEDREIDAFTARSVFRCLTNVNFDPAVLEDDLRQAILLRKKIATRLGAAPDSSPEAVEAEIAELRARDHSPESFDPDPDIRSAKQILLFGLKGLCAYITHALELGQYDPELSGFVYKALAAGQPDKDGAPDRERTLEQWLELALDCGKANLRAMELLDAGNTGTYGDPVPTVVSLGHVKGPCILVSGHDLKDLYALLRQTENTGINIYTHGEMLPAHGYPKLRAFPHLAGHFGTAWQNQHKELPDFPGPVLFTTNCIQDPLDYGDKIFTSGATGWPGCTHCADGDFSALIAKAKDMPGFDADREGDAVVTGYGRQTMLNAAPTLLEAAKSGKLRHIFLIGGCDGAKPGRNYYTEFAEKTPQDTLIITLACGKFRFFDKKLGDFDLFPRILDMGQCNDAYGAIKVALALAEALETDVNALPLSFILSWYEQKAVAILLTLLALGVNNIRLGPSLPGGFVSPNIMKLLSEQWGLKPITTPDEDLKAILG